MNDIEILVLELERKLPSMSIPEIARLVSRNWKKPHYSAKPYIDAMFSIYNVDEKFMHDEGRDIVARFLCNSGTFKGPIARIVKKELNKRIK